MNSNFTNTAKLRPGASKIAALALVFLVVCASSLKAQLSGTYTICPSGCDYKTIALAATDLNSKGVKGAVTFNVAAGNFNEAVTINNITGASATNTITFKGAGKTATRLYYNSGNILYLNYSRYITFEDMTIESVATSTSYACRPNYAQYCTFRNCKIKAPSYLTSNVQHYPMYAYYCTGMTYESCDLSGGYYCLYAYDYNYAGTGGHKYINNKITAFFYYGIYSYSYFSPGKNTFTGNYIDSAQSNSGYGIMAYYENGATITGNRLGTTSGINYGLYLYYPNYYGTNTGVLTNVQNNFIGGMNGYPLYSYLYYLSSPLKVKISHNTIHGYGSPTYGIYLYVNNCNQGVEFTNNSVTRATSGVSAYIYLNASSMAAMEGNNFYNTTSNISVTWNGTVQASLADYKKISGEKFASNVAMPFKSATDWHVDQSKAAPSGKYSGVSTDIDGDARCLLFPTCGADESTFGKSKPVVQIFGNTTVIYGSPNVFYNSAKAGEPKVHKWYIDGVYQTDSIHLETTKLTGPTNTIKLVTEGCGGKDSVTFNVSVTLPTKAPVSDFIADRNSILMGSAVNFYDLSGNGPSQWSWQIKPDSTYDFGLKVPAVKLTYADLSSPKWQGRFNYPGKYQICLTASNQKGMGNKECKADYIEVLPAVNMGQTTIIKDAKGYLYDNGGPNGSPTYNNAYSYTALIDPCADSVYLIIKDFALYCSYDYLQIYEGKDKTGRVLHKCTGNKGNYGLDGYTGSSAYICGSDCRPKASDTFIAAKSMFIVLDIKSGVNQTGIEAYWWSKPRSTTRPSAKFTSIDTICTNGIVAFTNASTGDEVTYQWDLDGDPSFMESTSKNATWPYFFPGQYKVTLLAANCGGVDTFVKNITVLDPPTPVIDFKADNTNPTTNDVVFFSSTTQQCVDKYEWIFTRKYGTATATFVNGTSRSSLAPQVVFSDTGLWSAELKGSNVTGTGNKLRKDYINVKGSYCNPSVSNLLSDLGISKLVFNTINNSSTTGVDAYQNYTPTVSTTLEIGVTYTLTMERPTAKNKANRTIWIDWNGDGDFDDKGEHVADENNSSALSWSHDITVPSIATVGATKLRVAINQSNYANKVCGQNEFGEYEDYRIYITPDLTAPVITRKGDDTVRVEQGIAYVDAGATALDNLDGDITAKIKLTSAPVFNALIPGTYVFSYNVDDASGNKAEARKRVVIIGSDKTPPALRIAKPDTIRVAVNTPFIKPQILSADDLVDGDMKSYVSFNNTVNTAVAGTYIVSFSVSDLSNNDTTVKRTVIVYDDVKPTMALVGADTVYHDVNTAYADAGVILNDNYYTVAELNNALVTSGNVNEKVLGTYIMNYSLTDPSGNGPVTHKRVIQVVDRMAPVLTLLKPDMASMEVNTGFMDPGIAISDNYYNIAAWDTAGTFYAAFPDGHATRLGTYTIIYEVTDGSGNLASLTRTLEVKDLTAPLIELKGQPTISVCRWSNYADAGYDLSDNYWANSDVTVTREGTFMTEGGTDLPGFYSFRYIAADKSGNVGRSSWRYVFVRGENDANCLTGIAEGDMSKNVNVYPNPNSGKFSISASLPATQQARISITNALGQEVAVISNGSLSNSTFDVDLSTQPSGIYMLKIVSAGYSITKQIVLNK